MHPWSHPQIIAVAEDGWRYEAFWDWVGCHHPAQPVWLLDSIAVEPAAQGRGLGLERWSPPGSRWPERTGSARFSRQEPSETSRSIGDVAFVWPRWLTRPRAAPRSISCDGTRSPSPPNQSRRGSAGFAAVVATLPSDGCSRRDLATRPRPLLSLVVPKRDVRDNRIQPAHPRLARPARRSSETRVGVPLESACRRARTRLARTAGTASPASTRDDQAPRQAALLRASK